MAQGIKLTRVRLENRKADAVELLEKQVCLLEEAQESLGDDFRSGPGGLMRTLTDKDAAKLTQLTRALESVVQAKIRLEAHQKKVGEGMTQAELVQAAADKIKALPRELRGPVITELARFHNKEVEVKSQRDFVPAMDALASLVDE